MASWDASFSDEANDDSSRGDLTALSATCREGRVDLLRYSNSTEVAPLLMIIWRRNILWIIRHRCSLPPSGKWRPISYDVSDECHGAIRWDCHPIRQQLECWWEDLEVMTVTRCWILNWCRGTSIQYSQAILREKIVKRWKGHRVDRKGKERAKWIDRQRIERLLALFDL